MIKAICFDLDGVYFTPESVMKFKQSIPTKVSSEKVNHVFHRSQEIIDFKLGQISESEYWNYARKELELPNFSNKDFFDLLKDCYEINPEVKSYIKEIRSKGYKACACSNNFITRVRELDNKFGFLQDFDTKVFSYEVGFTKPDKEIFKDLIEKSGVDANEIVYSDDGEDKLK